MNLKPAELSYWNKYVESVEDRESLRDVYVSAGYAGNPQITDELLALYLSGKKVAGSSLMEDFVSTGDPLPKVGNHWIYLNSQGQPSCILRTEKIISNKFRDVPAEIAIAEGEGDLSLGYWKRVHAELYTPHLEAWGVTDLDETTVITEFFKIIYRETPISGNISELIEKCVITSAWVKPESRITDTPEIYKIENAQSPFGHLNGVYRTRFGANSVDQLIQDHYRSFKDRRLNFRWYSFPHSTPHDLDSRLMALHPSSVTELAGLFCEVAQFQLQTPLDVTVEELTHANVDDYCRASNEGWGQSGVAAEKIIADTKRDLENGNMGHRAYLARYRGEPASTGLLRLIDGAGYLLGGSTSPRFRQKGVYSALVKHRVDELKKLNIPLALILARKATSAPICLNLGFSVGCECRSFDFNF